MVILLLVFPKVFAFGGFTRQNINLINSLIKHYSIKNIFLASQEQDNLQKYIEIFLNFDTKLTLNIHTNENLKNFNVDFMECCEMVFITGNNSNSFRQIFRWSKLFDRSDAKLIVLAFSNKIQSSFLPAIFSLTQIIMMTGGITVKVNYGRRSFELFTKAEEFISTDPYEAPELYWPTLKIGYFESSMADFPLVIGSEVPTSGFLLYFASAFEKFYENRRDRIIYDKSKESKYIMKVTVNPKITQASDGYPLRITKLCLMLPIIDEISEQDFLKKPFEVWVWICLFIFLIYFTISLRIIAIPDFFLCFYESLAFTLGSIQNGINNKYVYLQMFLYGFIIWNLHNAKLSSYLTTPNLGRRLETVEDINEANITLWANFYSKMNASLMKYMKKYHQKIYNYEQTTFRGKFNYSIGTEEFYKHLYNFDLSHGYLIDDIKWSFISRSQKLLKRKLFSYPDFCPEYGFVYPFYLLQRIRPLREIFASFTLKVIESGLDFAWEERSYMDINFKFRKSVEDFFHPLGIDYFKIIWWIFIFGIALGILSFCVEMFVQH